MIPAIEWVPAGVADPNPKKYEFSQAEVELIKMMEEQNFDETAAESDDEVPAQSEKKSSTKLPKIENTLPADLRMDEYSSDEDENDAVQGTTIGNLLLEGGNDEDYTGGDDDDADENENKEEVEMDSGDSDDDDDLDDVPDTREYTPLDVEGFTNLGLSQVGTSAPSYMEMQGEGEEEDDDSEAEDVQIQADDAIVVVAKAEDVSLLETCLRFDFVVPFLNNSDLKSPGFCVFGSSRIRAKDRESIYSPRYSIACLPVGSCTRRHFTTGYGRELLRRRIL